MAEQSYGFITLPHRQAKPRTQGVTLVFDNGMGISQLEDLIGDVAPYIDVIEFGYGVARLFSTQRLKRRIELLHANDIEVCTGGTLLELASSQNRVDDFLRESADLGFDYVKVQARTTSVKREEKLQLVEKTQQFGLKVFSDIGEKADEEDEMLSVEEQIDYARASLQAGASKVITDSRASSNTGVYDVYGIVQEEHVDLLVHHIGLASLIFEAPMKSQQVWFCQHYGNQVNLGGILPRDVIPLETLRSGLRPYTMRQHLTHG